MYILPQPNSIKYTEKKEGQQDCFCLRYDAKLVMDGSVEGADSCSILFCAKLLQEEIRKSLGMELTILRQKDNSESGVVFLTYGKGIGREAYTLRIDAGRVTIEGGGVAGILYGVQTLRQMIRQCGCNLPSVCIEDAPAMAHRGLSYDVTRGRVPTLDHLKRLVEQLSFYKYNQLQLYVEHTYLFQDFSEIWRNNTPLTAQEILELDAYCRDYQIELVPALASFGHLYEVLCSKSYSRLCELENAEGEPYSLVNRMGHHTVDVSNEESFALVSGRIEEFMGLFSSRYFNICADETFDLCKGRSKSLGEEWGVRTVYVNFLKRLCDFCIERGKIPMFWGDVLVEEPELLRLLPEEGVCLNWEYAPAVNDAQVKSLTEAGVKHLYVCPGVQSWNHLINRHGDAYRNIRGMCHIGKQYGAEGMLNTEWGDLGHIAHPEFSTVGQIYGAAFSWSEREMEEEEIDRAISILQYGDKKGEVVQLFRELAECECANWWHVVQYREEQCGLLKKKPQEQLCGILPQELGEREIEERLQNGGRITELLYRKLPEVSEERREDVCAYLIMGEGQRLFTLAGRYIRARKYKDNKDMEDAAGVCSTTESPMKETPMEEAQGSGNMAEDAQTGAELAVALERWLMHYKELWRRESKESELFRITEVVCWYADRLRDMAACAKVRT